MSLNTLFKPVREVMINSISFIYFFDMNDESLFLKNKTEPFL